MTDARKPFAPDGDKLAGYLEARPDQRFTAVELCELAKREAVGDAVNSMICVLARLVDKGKIKSSLFGGRLDGEDYRPRYWSPAAIEVDAVSGRRFKMTHAGRVWLDDEEGRSTT